MLRKVYEAHERRIFEVEATRASGPGEERFWPGG
jgi:hypothetical protein